MLTVAQGLNEKKPQKSPENGSHKSGGGMCICVWDLLHYHKVVVQGSIQGRQMFLERKSGIVQSTCISLKEKMLRKSPDLFFLSHWEVSNCTWKATSMTVGRNRRGVENKEAILVARVHRSVSNIQQLNMEL